MQEPSSKPKKGLYRLRRTDPHERLSAKLRHFSSVAAVLFVLAAAGIVIHSLYNIQIKNGATFRQYAAQQQLLDSTIQATRGEIYDTSGITLASTSVVWTIWADPSYSTALFTTQTDEKTNVTTKTVDCGCSPATARVWTAWTLPPRRTRPSTRPCTTPFPRATRPIRRWPPR